MPLGGPAPHLCASWSDRHAGGFRPLTPGDRHSVLSGAPVHPHQTHPAGHTAVVLRVMGSSWVPPGAEAQLWHLVPGPRGRRPGSCLPQGRYFRPCPAHAVCCVRIPQPGQGSQHNLQQQCGLHFHLCVRKAMGRPGSGLGPRAEAGGRSWELFPRAGQGSPGTRSLTDRQRDRHAAQGRPVAPMVQSQSKSLKPQKCARKQFTHNHGSGHLPAWQRPPLPGRPREVLVGVH